jgi:hypothetical protein
LDRILDFARNYLRYDVGLQGFAFFPSEGKSIAAKCVKSPEFYTMRSICRFGCKRFA